MYSIRRWKILTSPLIDMALTNIEFPFHLDLCLYVPNSYDCVEYFKYKVIWLRGYDLISDDITHRIILIYYAR